MFDGTTLIVDVVTLGENSYALSLPAEDLWVAYEVVRRHVDTNGVRHFSQMVEAKTTSDGYSFKFDTGDTFTCASHLGKPTSSTLSDTSSELPSVGTSDKNKFLHTNESTGALEWAEGGSGGGPLVVHATPSEDATTLDKTWQDIKDADAVSIIFDNAEENARNFYFCSSVFEHAPFGGGDTQYVVKIHDLGDAQIMDFIASSESGYPSYTYE